MTEQDAHKAQEIVVWLLHHDLPVLLQQVEALVQERNEYRAVLLDIVALGANSDGFMHTPPHEAQRIAYNALRLAVNAIRRYQEKKVPQESV